MSDGPKVLDTTRGLDLPGELSIEEIVSWSGQIFMKTTEHGILVKQGNNYFRMHLVPFKAKTPKGNGASAVEEPPASTP